MSLVPELERIGYRAALSLRCIDAVRGSVVADGLVATAWRVADPTARLTASRSRVSGLLGFGLVPRLRTHQRAAAAAGAPLVWPAPDPAEAYVVSVVDAQRRYLPVLLEVVVPVAAPVQVDLHSAPSRYPASGWAVVKGEIHDADDGAGVPWPVLTVSTGPDRYDLVADEIGRYLLIAPYPEALPPLAGSPPTGPGLSAMTWPLTLTVHSEPDELARPPGSSGTDPPVLSSILGQAAATLQVGGTQQPSITVNLAFGSPTVSTLTIQPA